MEIQDNFDNKYAFKGVFIPKDIWVSKELKAMEKLIFVEIYALDREFGCIANNNHFSEMFGLSERQVREYIKRLKDRKLIEVELNKVKDTRTIKVIGKFMRVSNTDAKLYGISKEQLKKRFSA